jgi:Flp pilus assembly CpaE family ATPase
MGNITVEPTRDSLLEIIKVAKESFDFVVVDAGSASVATKHEEFDLAKGFIQQADLVVLVASADPVGIFRLLAIESSVLELTVEPKLVINRLRNSVIPQAKSEIKTTLSKLGTIEIVAFFPEDSAQVDQATRYGMVGARIGRAGSFISAASIFTKSLILGKQGMLDARVAKLG